MATTSNTMGKETQSMPTGSLSSNKEGGQWMFACYSYDRCYKVLRLAGGGQDCELRPSPGSRGSLLREVTFDPKADRNSPEEKSVGHSAPLLSPFPESWLKRRELGNYAL